ncbi:hypothetical protein [Methylobacterium sp. CM6247]
MADEPRGQHLFADNGIKSIETTFRFIPEVRVGPLGDLALHLGLRAWSERLETDIGLKGWSVKESADILSSVRRFA